MTDLWLPFDKHREERLDRGRAQVREAQRLEAELKTIDPYLEVVYVSENSDFEALDFKPGYWHIRRTPDNAPPSYFPLMGPNGEPRPPEMKVVEDMKKADLWRQGGLQEMRDRIESEEKKRQKAADLHREQVQDESAAVFRAAKRVSGEGGMERRKWAKGLVGS